MRTILQIYGWRSRLLRLGLGFLLLLYSSNAWPHSLGKEISLRPQPGMGEAGAVRGDDGEMHRSNPEMQQHKWLGTDFPISPEIDRRARFWEKVFNAWTSQQVAFHDREHLDIVWKVLSVDTAASNNKRIERERRALEARLRRLEKTRTPMDARDRSIVSLLGGLHSPKLQGAWRRVRAQRGIADNFEKGLQRAARLMPKIRKTLKSHGVPPVLAALPFVESSYNPKARSWAGAAGLWQLMPATAREKGLTVNKRKDERFDVERATVGAAKLLASNYRLLKSWPLAITGYNHGPYGLKRAVDKMGSKELDTLIHHYQHRNWGFASKNFYAEFVAANRILMRQEVEGPNPAVQQKKHGHMPLRPKRRSLPLRYWGAARIDVQDKQNTPVVNAGLDEMYLVVRQRRFPMAVSQR